MIHGLSWDHNFVINIGTTNLKYIQEEKHKLNIIYFGRLLWGVKILNDKFNLYFHQELERWSNAFKMNWQGWNGKKRVVPKSNIH